MSKISVHSLEGQSVGSFELADEWMVRDRGEQAVHDYVVRYMANKRAGTACTKTRGLVSGGGKKPYKQKGTGRARAGSIRSPIWKGGGVIFGPRPRDFGGAMNKKTAQLAFRRALSDKIAEDKMRVIDGLKLEAPKTRAVAELLKKLGAERGALLVLAESDENVERSARNLPNVEVALAANVNVYQLLRYPLVVAAREAMDVLSRRLQPAGSST